MIRLLIAGIVPALAGLGCSQPEAPANPEKTEQAESHVWQDQTDTLDRARSVQDTLDEADKARKAALGEDDGGR